MFNWIWNKKEPIETCNHDYVEIQTIPMKGNNDSDLSGFCKVCKKYVRSEINWKTKKRFDYNKGCYIDEED